jgi:hypothetical protein
MNYKKLLEKLEGSHDLETLPNWGPYTKKYIGTSHISDKEKGLRFDLSIFPGYYRRRVDVPNVFYETEYYPWEASPDGKYYKFRHMLEWKDRVYSDISYHLIDEHTQGIKVNFINNTSLPESLVLHLMGSMHFPSIKEYEPNNILYPAEIDLSEKCKWIDATEYKNLTFATPNPTDNLVADGKLRGEIRTQNFVNGSGIEFGESVRDTIVFEVNIERDIIDVSLLLRYISKESENVNLKLEICDRKEQEIIHSSNIELLSTKKLNLQTVELKDLESGKYIFKLTSLTNSKINLDGFVLGNKKEVKKTTFSQINWISVPEIIQGSNKNSIILKYKDSAKYYGIIWYYPVEDCDIREFYCRDLDTYFNIMANNHVAKTFHGEGKGHFTNVFLRPITVPKNSNKEIYCAVSVSEDLNELKNKLIELNQDDYIKSAIEKAGRSAPKTPLENSSDINNEKELIKDTAKAVNSYKNVSDKNHGLKYKKSVELLKTVILTNIVYPVYTQKSYIRHSTPGKWWDCLYTWDSGFIGLGLMEMDFSRAIENLNAYLTEVDNQSAFIHHGSPVPVQHYLFFEIWNRTQSKELLEYFYPKLKQYYMFLSGNTEGSTTRKYKSNLLQTWDYFYNSGGWDDYPPQYYMHKHNLKNITPVITTAHCIRIAKFLKMYAEILELNNDSEFYENDITVLTKALQDYSWDEKAGYYSYVCHDETDNPVEVFKTEDGENFNKGLDGGYPILSGICTEVQEKCLIEKIKSPKHIWSKTGLSAVDQSASYYKKDGYWNGTVWMSHQWFFWKTLLDLGEYEFAEKVAMRALDIWKQETDSSYRCLEHFLIETKRGAGWHAFGGLSSPIINWFNAYYTPGTVNTGFDTIILSKNVTDNFNSIKLKIKNYPRNNVKEKTSILITMNSTSKYQLKDNKNNKIELTNIESGNIIVNIKCPKVIEELDIWILKKNAEL